MNQLKYELYTVAWIAPLEIEARAALLMLDHRHQGRFPMARGDDYVFQAGDACGHNIIIATIPPGQEYGTGSAAALASQVKKFFPNLWFGLLVGVAAGLPNLSRSPPRDIRLGDVLVGLSEGDSAGLIAYDLGKETETGGFQLLRSGHVLAVTETAVRSAIGSIKLNAPRDADVFSHYYKTIEREEHPDGTFADPGQSNDTLYQVDENGNQGVVQRQPRPGSRRTRVWYGSIGSGEKLMKNARKRDELRDRHDLIGLEMEAAGTMSRIPVGVIRGVCDYGDAHKNKEWQPYAAAMAAAYAKAVLAELVPKDVLPGPSIRPKRRWDDDDVGSSSLTDDGCNKRRAEQSLDIARPGRQEPAARIGHSIDAAVKQSLVDQLYFAKIDERLTGIAAAQAKTCLWFLGKAEYVSWHDAARLPDHGGFLWIKGHPGTGKSTLMKLLFEESKSDERRDASQVTLSFFFLARGTADEKSVSGLYRSLLHQLFQKEPGMQAGLDWMTADGAKAVQRSGWHEEALKQTLAHAVRRLGHRSLTIFIDALDECDQEQVSGMVSCFEELCDGAREASVRLRICFSSRHYPTVVIQRGVEVTLEDEIGHTEDIRLYIKRRLRLPNPASSHAESLRSEVLDKSCGIFLWAVLVLDILNSEFAQGSGRIKKMHERLKEIPPKLHDLFEMIMTRDGKDVVRLQLCLQWVLFAARPLKPQELYFAIELGCDDECSGLWDHDDPSLDEMKNLVRRRSKGLAEVTRNKASEVQFIHESVRDFLLDRYQRQWPADSGNFVDACSRDDASPADDSEAAFPFVEYSVSHVLHHGNMAQQNGQEQGQFLAHFPLQMWVKVNNAHERFRVRRYTGSVSLLYILAEKNLVHLIRIHPQRLHGFEVEKERYGPPFFAALAMNNHDAVCAFLEALAEDEPLTSPVHGLSERYRQNRSNMVNFGRDFKFPKKSLPAYLSDERDETICMTVILALEKLGMSPAVHGSFSIWALILKDPGQTVKRL
ncbi:hypothetical protein G6O67_004377 [Ophiocordyceps sinensis]|uniref:Nephrocystin 3-like N-terminal domain-containing protein n=1 Tax=Ophiocordyceps sinensis TaxID=72228 RepID=A0A8H4LZT3_9HYPO|nr:hypothetical protein G6O67_004377 [Ophiocordyceps sinensis]